MTYPRDLPVLATPPHLTMSVAQGAPYAHAQYAQPGPYAQPGMSTAQIAAILWAHRKQTLLIASAVILLAVAVAVLWPRTYQANATLMVNFEVNDPLSGREFPVGLLTSYMATQVELASSSEVLLPVIDQLRLTENKVYTAGYSGDAAGLRDWVETRVRKKLLVEQGKYGSQLIYVTYAAGKPQEAAQVANAIAEVYAEKQYRRLTGPASERAERYTKQLAELKGNVASAQQQVVEFRQRSGATADQSAGNEALGPAMIHAIKSQLATQTVTMAQLRATMGSRHPEVRALQSQIDANRRALSAEMGAYAGNAAAELESRQYQLELESAQSIYKRALDGYDQIKLASLGGYTNIDFVSRATAPAKASKPKVRIILLLAGFAGLGLGILIPLCYDLLNRRVRCRDDVERDHGIPVLMELGSLGTLAQYPARGAA